MANPNPVAVYVLKQTKGYTYLTDQNGILILDKNGNPIPVFAPSMPGKIYVGGNFTQVGGVTRRYLGLINPNGTVCKASTPGWHHLRQGPEHRRPAEQWSRAGR